MREDIEAFKHDADKDYARVKQMSNDARHSIDKRSPNNSVRRSTSPLKREKRKSLDSIKFDDEKHNGSSGGPVYSDIRKLADHVYNDKPGIPLYRPRFDHLSHFVPFDKEEF